jgi:hypothetical protein
MRMGRALVAGAACAMLVGCGGSSSPRPTLSDAEVQAVLSGTTENADFLVRTEEELVARCMEVQGFKYYPNTQAMGAGGSPFGDPSLGVEDARNDGYGLAVARNEASRSGENLNAALAKSLPQAERDRYERTLFGDNSSSISVALGSQTVSTPTNGCISDARKMLYGDLEKWLRLDFVANNVLSDASLLVEADEPLIEAQKEWSACMSSAGYVFEAPRAAREAAAELYEQEQSLNTDSARSGEINIATADAKCRQDTKLAPILRAAQARAAAQTVSARQGDLLAAAEMRTEAAKVAARLLEQSESRAGQ